MIPTEKPGSPEELVHYGVKGMQWGVRKKRDGSSRKQAKREAKAQKFVKKSLDLDVRISELQTKSGSQGAVKKYGTKIKIHNLEGRKAQADKDAEAKRQGKMSKRQKQVVVGTAVVATLVAAGVLYTTMNSGSARQTISKGREVVTGKPFRFKFKPELADPNLSSSAVMKQALKVNPGYRIGNPAAYKNCRRCTIAYEMRRRGYDVMATGTVNARGQDQVGLFNLLDKGQKDLTSRQFLRKNSNDPLSKTVKRFAQNTFNIDSPSSKKIFETLSKQPERSRGEVVFKWLDGGGHSMAYEIINGTPHLIDAQSGVTYTEAQSLINATPRFILNSGFRRLDNVDFDENFVRRWVKNAK